ncbi:MAG: hydrogenase nickel incorporation protein HypB [Clostridia bacterium]|nr:hydrogenase nickel incorporation protein HypB [Clostridia bacterium]MDN5322649.1 hydrogenase nickel incorporation protein HypB [Clostridia bacterium]
MTQVKLQTNILQANDVIAGKLKEKFKENNVKVINLISSPGAGKTTILEHSLPKLTRKYNVGVIEGDVLTSRDADRIARLNVPVVQIETKGACHLDANMVQKAVEELDLKKLDLVIIENVGNLVCPATFELAEDAKVVILSVAEGSDKPAKYPTIFTRAKACILNKMDLLAYSNFSLDEFYEDIMRINPKLKIFKVSAITENGLEYWLEWLEGMMVDGGQKN